MPTRGLSYRFSHAIARSPGKGVAGGLRAEDRGQPDAARFRAEHENYVSALERAGLQVMVLDALDAYPDSVFIEDDALYLPEGVFELRPGAPSRTAESGILSAELSAFGHDVHPNHSDGFIDGGDVLVTDSALLVGLSKRTDRAGFDWLRSMLEPNGYEVLAVETPGEVLHFKSDCCVLGSQTILATSRLSGTEAFRGFRILEVPAGEEAAANSIRVNDTVLIPEGFPATAELLAREDYRLETVPVSQAALLDGGLSCMSLRYRARS